MKVLAALSAFAGVVWLMAGAQMIVGAENSNQALYGASTCFVGLGLIALFAFLLGKVARL